MNNSPVIIALDFNQAKDALLFVEHLHPNECRVKVGKELFTASGPMIIDELHKRNFEVFLDLKFHDIPHTVYKAVKAAASLGVWMLNVHASGGREMMLQARAAITESQHKPLLIAVTVLTSMSNRDFNEIGYNKNLEQQAIHLARLGHACALDGVVCAAMDAQQIKAVTSSQFLTITPGIRLTSSPVDDQKRVMTPVDARKNRADYLVLGRPITQAPDPRQLLQQINREIMLTKDMV